MWIHAKMMYIHMGMSKVALPRGQVKDLVPSFMCSPLSAHVKACLTPQPQVQEEIESPPFPPHSMGSCNDSSTSTPPLNGPFGMPHWTKLLCTKTIQETL